jgi:hypothetical protein
LGAQPPMSWRPSAGANRVSNGCQPIVNVVAKAWVVSSCLHAQCPQHSFFQHQCLTAICMCFTFWSLVQPHISNQIVLSELVVGTTQPTPFLAYRPPQGPMLQELKRLTLIYTTHHHPTLQGQPASLQSPNFHPSSFTKSSYSLYHESLIMFASSSGRTSACLRFLNV